MQILLDLLHKELVQLNSAIKESCDEVINQYICNNDTSFYLNECTKQSAAENIELLDDYTKAEKV